MDIKEFARMCDEVAKDIKEGSVKGWYGLPEGTEFEDECDHTVTVIPKFEKKNVFKPQKVKASEYPELYHQIFNDEKFDYCPECGEKINWVDIENQIGG